MDNIFELFNKLLKLPKEHIHYALVQLMIQGKIDFLTINKAYIEYLETEKDDKALKLADANGCTLSLLANFKEETKSNHADIHWARIPRKTLFDVEVSHKAVDDAENGKKRILK